uniref:Neuralized n=1 Tax=Haemonchus contortus TaxID=6289 RepID=A0A6F7PS48_HAECO
MGNGHGTPSSLLGSFSDLGGIPVNQGTIEARLPQLGFHAVHGQNIVLQKGGRVARRKESFCKGLAFSNRPVSVNENVCIRLTEVSTSWSGVLRFGVTNVDPETYRTIQVPKFACPDLTSKEGFWAKALPERYSVEGNILHFSITHTGDLYYGVNGIHKGVFLVGINVSLPVWIIVDIYGNSVAVEFVDPSDFHVPCSASITSRLTSISSTINDSAIVEPAVASSQQLQLGATSSSPNFDSLRFHQMAGRHISLNSLRNIATRCGSEYTQGYVFSERPIRNNEKVVIEVIGVQQLYKGGLAFGVTCCDPSTLRSTDLPDDSSDLIEMPQYWVGIKDIALQPRVNTVLSFWITDTGEVKFEKDQGFPRTVLHVDNTLPLYMYFDLYGSTQAIKMRGTVPITRSHSPLPKVTSLSTSAPTRVALPPLPTMIRREPSSLSSSRQAQPYEFSSNIMRVLLRAGANGTTAVPHVFDDDCEGNVYECRRALPPRTNADELLRHTIDDIPTEAPTDLSCPSTLTPRLDLLHTRQSDTAQDSSSSSHSSFPNLQNLGTSFMHVGRLPSAENRESSKDEDAPREGEIDECTVCMSAKVNSALYKCGHSCMCYDCAMQTYRSSGLCPLCRASILDVIKIFKA